MWFVLVVVGAIGTVWWLRRLWKRRGELASSAKTAAVVFAASAMLGALGTSLGLIKAFGAVGGESVDPSQKARILGEGISEAINFTALAMLLWIPSWIVLAILARKRRS